MGGRQRSLPAPRYRAHSPYFQDIPGEFLDFCQSGANQPDTGFRLPESTLQLMRFEHSQLLAETAPAPLAFSFEWDEDTPFALSHTAQLGDYPFDVCADEPDPQSEAVSVLVWQDSSGSVYSRPIDAVDKILLQAAAESPLSQAQICRTLAEVTQTPAEQWQHQITDRWQQWIDEDILLPQNGSQP
ncbi:hypothetical protein [Kingella potus]|uniref:HvfC family peptide modification chaperone n=1 Tax=Kingella potus TaxID=265175 RepID=UPI001FD4D9C0|nr:hypothetical protein [Kingella potus]UOP00944.1 hypothetical protein LVJ84_00555 [Kingella potus]